MGRKINFSFDMGANSIGWAVIECDDVVNRYRILSMNSRVFDAGVAGSNEEIASGKAESRCAARREKRLLRRQTARRRRRMTKVRHILQRYDMLPQESCFPQEIAALDKKLLEKYTTCQDNISTLSHVLPYYLRRVALDNKLEQFELGRALYHLAQRRGFQSNRKQDGNDDETGIVKSAISELKKSMAAVNARTIGEYFSNLDPSVDRIRERYTSRDLYLDEFEQICEAQKHIISPELYRELKNAMFRQRPLKSVKNLIGKCQLEPDCRRAPWSCLEAQEFRIYHSVNNLRVIDDGRERPLAEEEKHKLADALNNIGGLLDKTGNLTYNKAGKVLQLSKNCRFAVEDDKKEKLKGNTVNAALMRVFGDEWLEFSDDKKNDILQDLRSYTSESGLAKRAREHWGLSAEKSREFAAVRLEPDYCALSREAIRNVMPDLKAGIDFKTIEKNLYPESRDNRKYDFLPLLEDVVGDLRNPVVSRCLTELRKVVNQLIAQYGKPDFIKLELARDIKNSRKQKEQIIKRNRENEKKRENARARIREELHVDYPSRHDITKVLLAEECNWICPYTGKNIGLKELLSESQFDIEHIIPFSLSMDNSFANKTLCYHDENRHVKRNRAPYEAYSGDEVKYENILKKVSEFQGNLRDAKLRRFKMTPEEIEELLADFSQRQLNDTRYASKVAAKYLGLLFGGVIDSSGTRRVQTVAGGITAIVRNLLGLNYILGDGVKSRDDHRHHAIDAATIGIVESRLIKSITDSIKEMEKKQAFADKKLKIDHLTVLPYWKTFKDDVHEAINNVLVSHKKSNRVRGSLHEETIYGNEYEHEDAKGRVKKYRYVRKALSALEPKKIDLIVDHGVRKAVAAKFEEMDAKNFKVFENPDNLPEINGIPIKRVKIKQPANTFSVGKKGFERNVMPKEYHHMAIVAHLDDDGNEIKWEGIPVSMYDAYRRKAEKRPVINKDFGPNRRFKFTLTAKSIIELDNKDGAGREFYIIRSIPLSRQIFFVRVNDARKKEDIQKSKEWFSSMPDGLRKRNCKKYSMTPLGELRRAND